MSEAVGSPGTSVRESFSISTASRLQLYGYALALIYAAALIHYYLARAWIIDGSGAPIYSDFTDAWVAGWHALNADASQLYDSNEFVRIQKAIIGARDYFYPNWPYPPTFFLILAPLSTLPYVNAFLTWDVATLLGCLLVVHLIVRRPPAIALVLASPFTVWNFLAGQNGFLTASLLGASLFFLERRPIVAGAVIGCLTYKPQFGILLPVALVASRQWRAIASAGVAAAVLAGASIALFGADTWAAFPHGFVEQSKLNLGAGPDSNWGYLQTVYGLIRTLNGSATVAWLGQGLTTVSVALIVWLVWRSRVRYALKAATLSAAALIATPYAFAYDMAALAIPVAFLVKDQIGHGMLKGEQPIIIALFGASLATLVILGDSPDHITFGGVPLAPFLVITLLAVILRRALLQSSAGLCMALRKTSPGRAYVTARACDRCHTKMQVLDSEACGCRYP
jgi:arabinofuranan 3-O-arabinosyltransferase